MGKVLAASIEIRATAADIWPYLTDIDLQREWVPGLVSTEIVEGTPLKAGTRTRQTYRFKRIENKQEGRSTRIEPYRLMETVVIAHGVSIRSRCALEERNAVTTITWQYEPINPTLRRRLYRKLLHRFFLLDLQQALRRLKQKVEAPSVPLEPIEVLPGIQALGAAVLAIFIPLIVAVVQIIFFGPTGLPIWQLAILFLVGFLILIHLSLRARRREIALPEASEPTSTADNPGNDY